MWNPFKSKKPTIKVSPFLGPAIYDEAGEFSIPIIRGGEQIFAEGYANPYIFFSVNTIASFRSSFQSLKGKINWTKRTNCSS